MITQIMRKCHAEGIFEPDDITDIIIDDMETMSDKERNDLIYEAVNIAVGRCESNFRFVTPIPQKKTTTTQQTVNVTHTRATRIRNSWERAINAVVCVAGTRKRLADCRRVDVEWLVRELEDQANALNNKADWYRHIAARMDDHMKVSDIATPADLLEVA